jgi:hypothetical protein
LSGAATDPSLTSLERLEGGGYGGVRQCGVATGVPRVASRGRGRAATRKRGGEARDADGGEEEGGGRTREGSCNNSTFLYFPYIQWGTRR